MLRFDRSRGTAAVTTDPRDERRRALLAVIVGLAALLVIGGGLALAGVWPFGASDTAQPPSSQAASARYVDVPAMVVTLRSADGRQHFLKLHFVIVAADTAQVGRITAAMPLILDTLQSFLRELRPEDLSGSAAVFRVKEEIVVRLRDALGRDGVSEVLIQDLIEQ
ncbi:flagellar basal body-associated FliL family protein [Sphingomonas sp. BK580]|uniref:flagellar basal body-associated FliL family protein n=1 Tax=Sphingomonas sp. BK580 TaxID=2586972 RepID=UPI00288A476A|nr:flagellar basal body-associated FliL family protein [Sphingomonas sp. BK580]